MPWPAPAEGWDIETAWRYVKLPFQIILFPVAFPFFMWWHRKRIAALRAMDNARNWSA